MNRCSVGSNSQERSQDPRNKINTVSLNTEGSASPSAEAALSLEIVEDVASIAIRLTCNCIAQIALRPGPSQRAQICNPIRIHVSRPEYTWSRFIEMYPSSGQLLASLPYTPESSKLPLLPQCDGSRKNSNCIGLSQHHTIRRRAPVSDSRHSTTNSAQTSRKSKQQQAEDRQQEIIRQNQMSASLTEASSSTTPRSNLSSTPSSTHIVAQASNSNALSSSTNNSTSTPVLTSTRAAATTASPTKNITSSQTAASSRTTNTTVLGTARIPGQSFNATHAQSTSPSVSRNSTSSTSLAQPTAATSAQQSTENGMSTGQKVLLAAGILSSIFLLGYFISWWLKRRHRRLSSQRKVEKFNIKGPFKKSEENMANTDNEPMFGRPSHASISFDHLQVLTEKPTPTRSDLLLQPRLPYPSFKSPSVDISSLNFQRSPVEPKPLPNLNSVSPLSLLNIQAPSDYRCKGPQMKGKTFVVERTYQAALDDELVLHVGDRIEVVFYYDDGWCLGRNLDIARYAIGQLSKGVFPRDCVAAQPIVLNKQPEGSSGTNTNEGDLASPQTVVNETEEESRRAFRAISSNPSLSPLSSSIFEKFPLPPRSTGTTKVETKQRVSSLFIGRNAQLFLELDDALGQPPSPPRIQFASHIHFANPPKNIINTPSPPT
ncbi:hypothetical protein PCANC_06329 [Puccinia coronata f. sp. avenae]|uniref:SH3 domain-containing protein n=1 Tax=Puccinia coronata f. sp. avenae TaxID=200324 RepID=A0A2N5T1M5_9BASI|nr:hypothetical protein PCANC_06329 [Puccinia coronata f. sp. avenae]